MGNSLRELTDIILFIEHSDEEWIEIDKTFKNYMKKRRKKKKRNFYIAELEMH